MLAGRAANRHGTPVVLDPVGVGATRMRTAAARRILAEVAVAIVRGNAAEVSALVGEAAEIRGVNSVSAGDPRRLALTAAEPSDARSRSPARSITSPVSGGSTAVSNGVALLGQVTGTGCMATALCGCFAAVNPRGSAPRRDRGPGRLRGRRRARRGGRPRAGQLPRQPLRRGGGARPGDPRLRGAHRVHPGGRRGVILHAIVADAGAAAWAARNGASVVQLRLKDTTHGRAGAGGPPGDRRGAGPRR